MLQASPLFYLCQKLKEVRSNFNIICFTGFLYKNLLKKPPSSMVNEFLGEIDVLIDGPYIERLNDNKGLRGSANQRIYYLSNKLISFGLENQSRKLEIDVTDGEAFIVGIPAIQFSPAWEVAMEEVQGVER